jgi:hypothetical protein
LVQLNSTGNTISTPLVASARKVGNVKVLRVNGVQAATDSTVMGATTVTTAAIGFNPQGASEFHNGTISVEIIVKGTLSDADMLVLERFAALTLPNAPSF